MGRIRNGFGSKYTKIAFAAILGAIGIIVGIQAGFALLPNMHRTQASDKAEPNNQANFDLSFVEGDLFPLEPFEMSDGTEGSFVSLFQDQHTLVIFLRPECIACHELLQTLIQFGIYEPDVKLRVVFASFEEHSIIQTAYGEELGGRQAIRLDSTTFTDVYNLRVWPTMITVDQYGLINSIQMDYYGTVRLDILQFAEIYETH